MKGGVTVTNLAFCQDIKPERDCDNMWRVVSISSARSARPHNSSLSNSAFIRDESIDGVCSKKGRSSLVRPADWKFTRSTRLNGELRDNSLFQSFIVSYGGILRKVSYHPRLSSSKVILIVRLVVCSLLCLTSSEIPNLLKSCRGSGWPSRPDILQYVYII